MRRHPADHRVARAPGSCISVTPGHVTMRSDTSPGRVKTQTTSWNSLDPNWMPAECRIATPSTVEVGTVAARAIHATVSPSGRAMAAPGGSRILPPSQPSTRGRREPTQYQHTLRSSAPPSARTIQVHGVGNRSEGKKRGEIEPGGVAR